MHGGTPAAERMASDGDEADLQVPESAPSPELFDDGRSVFRNLWRAADYRGGEWDAVKRFWEVCCAIVAIGVIVGSVGLTVWMLMQFKGY